MSLTSLIRLRSVRRLYGGAIAQLGERLHGMQEVGGSIPPGSTIDRADFGSRAAARFAPALEVVPIV
jgi:hypothetical protein